VQSGTRRSIALAVEGDTRGEWDPDRLEQVLSNLLANAVEHGGDDAPVRVRVQGTAADSVLLTVANSGVIPPAVLPVVFDRFERGVKPESRPRGLGLGLYIVQQIVLAHGGTIEVQSSEEAGTCFSVRLPRTASAGPPTRRERADAGQGSGRSGCLLE
jgi:two-component system sensor histidine kinase/response regulator